MGINRRDFLKLTAASGLLLASDVRPSHGAEGKELPPEALGILYDATLCIGCKSCMFNCSRANFEAGGALYSEDGATMSEWSGNEKNWDAPEHLSSKTVNVIEGYRDGSGAEKDREADGFSFVKRHCMHCVDPGCVSACPVSAMEKDSRTGVVTYNKDKCIGCRYCQIACPFNIPKFEWELALPQIRKCQMCGHLQAQGGYPACCEFCPTGASVFGPVTGLRREAQRRLGLAAGEDHEYPLGRIDGPDTVSARAVPYNGKVYGMKEVGGTQYLLMAGVPFGKLGLPDLPSRSYASASEGIQHTLYKNMIAPAAIFGGLLFAAYRTTRSEGEGGRDE